MSRNTGGGDNGAKLAFVYCSGTWVHGDSEERVNDLTPVAMADSPTQPIELVAWRADFEKEVLAASDVLDVLIIRPGLVYGGCSAMWNPIFSPLLHGVKNNLKSVKVSVDATARPGLIHVMDVAAAFCLTVEKLPLLVGDGNGGVYPVFDIVARQETMKDIVLKAASELGFKGPVEFVGTGKDLFMKAMCCSGNVDCGRAKGMLEWWPRREGFVEGMAVFARAWEASVEGKGE